MPLSPSNFSTTLKGLMALRGFVGSDLDSFTSTLGDGIINAVVGKPFATVDLGTSPGAGVGVGTGLVVSPGTVSPLIFSTSASLFGGSGPDLLGLCDDIESAFISEMGVASLSSTHLVVFLGSGTVTAGSIPVTASEITSSLVSAGPGNGLLGVDWASFASAVGAGIQAGVLTAAGTVTITGAGTGPPVPMTPGVGVGVIA